MSSCWLLCRSRTERLFPETATAALESRSRGEPGMEELGKAWDDVSGMELDAKEVRKARRQEMEYVERKGVWHKITIVFPSVV